MGSNYKVKVYHQDPLFDDYLGQSSLDKNGRVSILVAVADIYSIDSLQETPDIYFILEDDGKEVFHSEVYEQVNFDRVNAVTNRPNQTAQEFGSFKVKLGWPILTIPDMQATGWVRR